MSNKKPHYTAEFKQEALNLAEQLGNGTEAARRLGIGDTLLHSWEVRARRTAAESNAGSARLNSPPIAEAEEIRRLRRENQELKKVNQILKSAAAFFRRTISSEVRDGR